MNSLAMSLFDTLRANGGDEYDVYIFTKLCTSVEESDEGASKDFFRGASFRYVFLNIMKTFRSVVNPE